MRDLGCYFREPITSFVAIAYNYFEPLKVVKIAVARIDLAKNAYLAFYFPFIAINLLAIGSNL